MFKHLGLRKTVTTQREAHIATARLAVIILLVITVLPSIGKISSAQGIYDNETVQASPPSTVLQPVTVRRDNGSHP